MPSDVLERVRSICAAIFMVVPVTRLHGDSSPGDG